MWGVVHINRSTLLKELLFFHFDDDGDWHIHTYSFPLKHTYISFLMLPSCTLIFSYMLNTKDTHFVFQPQSQTSIHNFNVDVKVGPG